MLKRTMLGMFAGAVVALAGVKASAQEELTIFWAEWDPANYLQELANLYTAETGTVVTVRDDGKGFREERSRGTGFGLQNMRRRAEAIGGTLQVRPGPRAAPRSS